MLRLVLDYAFKEKAINGQAMYVEDDEDENFFKALRPYTSLVVCSERMVMHASIINLVKSFAYKNKDKDSDDGKFFYT